MDKLITLEAEIVTDTKLIIEGAAEVKIDASESITLEIAPDTYVLGSIGSFNTASSWVGAYVNELVRESIGTGGSLKDALDWIRTYVMDQIEIGVNQVITQVENEFVSNSTLATTLGSEIGGVRASILDVKSTYATKTQAQAYSVDAIKASFGGDASSSAIEAFIGNIAVAKVDADSATASTVTTLIASMNNQTVRIDEMDEVLITAEGWAASASKLITAPDGSITGWSFGDGSGIQSQFKVYADNFVIQGAAVPIEYDNSAIVLPKTYEQSSAPTSGMLIGDTWIDTDDNNKVYTYTSTGWKASVSNKTFAQTTQPTTGMITNDIWYDTDDNNKPYYYTGSAWSAIRDGTIAIAQATADSKTTLAAVAAQGYVLPAGVANAINTNTTTINGAKITTGTIAAAQIAAGAITVDKISSGTAYISSGSFALGGNSSLSSYGCITAFTSNTSTKWASLITSTAGNAGAIATTSSSTGNDGYAGGFYNSTSTSYSVHRTLAVFGHPLHGGSIINNTNSTSLQLALNGYAAYAVSGGFGPFTGSHDALYLKSEVLPDIGDIVCDTGYAIGADVFDTITGVTVSTVPNSKAACGVFSGVIEGNLPTSMSEQVGDTEVLKEEHIDVFNMYNLIMINSVGEGMINICSEGGDFEVGDYIVTSSIRGKGKKQNDDVLHNYTVAKARENVVWANETGTTKMIACTYHCG